MALSFFNYLQLHNNNICYHELHFSQIKKANNLAKTRKYSIRSPLEDACPLMSSFVRSCEFSTITSGTERKRGFAGILPCRSGTFMLT